MYDDVVVDESIVRVGLVEVAVRCGSIVGGETAVECQAAFRSVLSNRSSDEVIETGRMADYILFQVR